MNKLIVASPLIFLVFIAGCASYGPKTAASSPTSPTVTTGEEHTVEITVAGFNPSSLTIKSGDKVTFVNKDTTQHWTASAVHPTHCEYKGCGVFDAKRGLNTGENYSMVFDLVGNWKYHDHLNPSVTGTVIVQ